MTCIVAQDRSIGSNAIIDPWWRLKADWVVEQLPVQFLETFSLVGGAGRWGVQQHAVDQHVVAAHPKAPAPGRFDLDQHAASLDLARRTRSGTAPCSGSPRNFGGAANEIVVEATSTLP